MKVLSSPLTTEVVMYPRCKSVFHFQFSESLYKRMILIDILPNPPFFFLFYCILVTGALLRLNTSSAQS